MSVTMSGFWLLILNWLAGFLNIPQDNLVVTGRTIVTVVSVLLIYWGRYRQGDINFFGFKKA